MRGRPWIIRVSDYQGARAGCSREAIRFVGNAHYGTDLALPALHRHYDAVIFSTGARADRGLDIPGIELPGSYRAANAATDVHVFARRGPAQIIFSPMEFRELSRSPNVDVIVHPEGFETAERRHHGRADRCTAGPTSTPR